MIEAETPKVVFERDGEHLVPTALAGGPWNPEAQHGGAVAGLLAHSIERLVPDGMRMTRLTVDLFGEVPMAPLQAEAEVLRPGSRVMLVGARLFDGRRTLARGTAQVVRTTEVDPLPGAPRERPPPRPVDAGPPSFAGVDVPGWIRAVDFVRGADPRDAVWTRLRAQLVAGEPTSRLVALCALSDFASGTRNPLDFERYVSINPDLTLHVERAPCGDWIAIDGHTWIGGDGTGQSAATLYDEEGPVARALASLYVAPRD